IHEIHSRSKYQSIHRQSQKRPHTNRFPREAQIILPDRRLVFSDRSTTHTLSCRGPEVSTPDWPLWSAGKVSFGHTHYPPVLLNWCSSHCCILSFDLKSGALSLF